MAHGRKYRDAASRYDKEHKYTAREAFDLVKTLSSAKFDETVEVVYTLGIDAKKADQLVRGTVSLPHGTGQDVKVAVFCTADKEAEAEEAGADIVGGAELIEKLQNGTQELDADVAIATPDMMSEVGKLGRILGPRGLMPNPKSGTVTDDLAKTVAEFKAGKIEYRNDRYGNIHVPIGKVSFEVDALFGNLKELTAEIQKARPAGAKGRYMRAMTVSSTMGPGVKVDPARLEEMVEELV
jgi:large subunit ribosomal protein L1